MYLKSIEVHGFKSFANKILFEFHNGITGIVGPNGSGKSNVADAVRWVLGEQRMKQLRGANMQDVIFSGTENRKPLSYAYVAITLDNSDRALNLDFNEVTVARRVYRSGESEYLINKTVCRLKDISELFYDTGIGKEGYSIIGQGQIDKILSGKPEDRRELFDEAAGIVKFKRRKAAACKKLENEKQNLLRVSDIIEELEKQVKPLEKQSEKARIYLKKKEELKKYDVNLFLLETQNIQKEKSVLEDKIKLTEEEYRQSNASFDRARDKYTQLEHEMEKLHQMIEQIREKAQNANVLEGKLTGEINVIKEQISAKDQRKEQLQQSLSLAEQEMKEKQKAKAAYEAEQSERKEWLLQHKSKKDTKEAELTHLQAELNRLTQQIEQGKQEVIELLNKKASTKAGQQRYDTMLEQANIRRSQLHQILIRYRSQEEEFMAASAMAKTAYADAQEELKQLRAAEARLEQQKQQRLLEKDKLSVALNQDTIAYHKQRSRYDSLKNIAERYDGYGSSIRHVMEQRDKEPGILGVVADLIRVEKQYETAIETALGGSIQNIVTEDENTAKKMIQYLKQNKYGRATFLPLTSMRKNKAQANQYALEEDGVVGMADMLVHANEKYKDLLSQLLGRTYVVLDIDHAVALARKFHYSLKIVTLDGESLSPGGSMTGGAFRNSSNLLGRKREIEALKAEVFSLKNEMEHKQSCLDEANTALAAMEKELNRLRSDLSQAMLKQNTAKLQVERMKEQTEEKEKELVLYQQEGAEIEQQLLEINKSKDDIAEEIRLSSQREAEIEAENSTLQDQLADKNLLFTELQTALSAFTLDEANDKSQLDFVRQNIARIQQELQRMEEEKHSFLQEKEALKEEIADKQQQADELCRQKEEAHTAFAALELTIKQKQTEREQLLTDSRQLMKKREELSEHINVLDKELFRLNNQREKLLLTTEEQVNYMWEEYELTFHNALDLRDQSFADLNDLKKLIAAVKNELKSLGDVSVNAIEDYKNLMERYDFLKTQHDDLVEAEKALMTLIEDLDQGMRTQFSQKFAEIKLEFNKVFQQLFGGGKGTLLLVEEEDILECGIGIIAQPPGKKLQNMMMLSGGEKALTAIALLFAIQNLKPSPFCLLDEIEAALDDSNVSRFASYLHKLTRHTQFIIITHRRGTMVAADRLYGITMQEKGVSALVSVNLIENDLEG